MNRTLTNNQGTDRKRAAASTAMAAALTMRQSYYGNAFRASALASSLLVLGCGYAADDGGSGSESDQDIIGGTTVTPSQNASNPWISVIGLNPTPDLTFPNCTATKIREGSTVDTYLTAAHCVAGSTAGSPVRYTNNIHFGANFISTVFRSVFQHPSCRLNADVGLGTNCLHASRTTYDVAVFTIDKNSSIPALPTNPNILNRTIGVSELLRMIGYGDQAGSTNPDSPKQTATVTTVAQGSADNATFAHYLRVQGNPQGGGGDSGGPVLTVTGGNRIAGITSFLDGDGTTNFVRVNNVLRWIANPQKLNVIADQEMGFLLNRGSQLCMQLPFSPVSALPGMSDCSGANQPTDQQYWRLLRMDVGGSGSGFYQIQNTQSGQCVSAGGVLGAFITDCNSSDLSQHWAFKIILGSFPRIQNRNNGQCLGGSSSVLTADACNINATSQQWLFFP
jgi:hypothetical protein